MRISDWSSDVCSSDLSRRKSRRCSRRRTWRSAAGCSPPWSRWPCSTGTAPVIRYATISRDAEEGRAMSESKEGGTTGGRAKPGPQARVDPKLLELLVCPLTKEPLRYDAAAQGLISDQIGRAHV